MDLYSFFILLRVVGSHHFLVLLLLLIRLKLVQLVVVLG